MNTYFHVKHSNHKIKSASLHLLKKYRHITVRECDAKNVLANNCIDSLVVLDPTMLIKKDEWLKILPGKVINRKFILLYQIHSDRVTTEKALMLSKITGYPIVRVCTRYDQAVKPGKPRVLPSLAEIISMFANAKYIVTDSFHGTAFAVNFNIPFIMNLSKDGSDTTRQKSLLSQVGLENRTDENVQRLVSDKIDWKNVNNILDIQRKKSYETLVRMIED